MVEDRITDGKRIGQLFASELTGLERGALGAVSVEDAEPDVEPTAEGAFAFRIAADGDALGTVSVTETTARLELSRSTAFESERGDVTVEEEGRVVVAHSGAAVKALVDAVAASLQ
ncbi:hypothetical protein [Haloarcula laminariae]|uniref:hypothetical protein n=1 Tax=Haloarcula laminariae TaxID=2961577 RepID=UPI002405EF5F|nr:hypothetical protein [Halomicroarcula sp. FL173]